MNQGQEGFWATALPIVESDAFMRLRRITFLGVLSPFFSSLSGNPLKFKQAGVRTDGSRAHHSFKVAVIAAKISTQLQMQEPLAKYAIAWGLLHDIATWPLSHTGEAAFASSTGTDPNALRCMMITGDNRLPASLSLYPVLKMLGIDPGLLLAIFDKGTQSFDEEFAAFHRLVHSTITPDTLEGMHRSGRVFDVEVPSPDLFISALDRDLVSGLRLRKSHSQLAFKFWRGKTRIYSDYINSDETIAFESTWSRAIRDAYANASLSDTLQLSEGEIVERVFDTFMSNNGDIVRYKGPLLYGLADGFQHRRSFDKAIPLEALSRVFLKAAQTASEGASRSVGGSKKDSEGSPFSDPPTGGDPINEHSGEVEVRDRSISD